MAETIDLVPTPASTDSGTPEVVVTDTVASQDNVENAPTQEVVIEDQPKDEPGADKAPTQRNLAAEEGKIKHLEKENARIAKDIKAKEDVLNRIEGFLKTDRKGYESFRQHNIQAYGIDPGSYEDIFGATVPTKTTTSPTTPKAITQQEVEQMVEQKIKAQEFAKQIETGFEDFTKEYPQLDPSKMGADEKEAFGKQEWPYITQIAYAMKERRPGMTMGDALKSAYKALNQGAELKKAQEQGELAARQKQLAGGTITPISSSAKTEPLVVRMTVAQRERYEELKKRSPSVAKHFAESIKERQES